MNDAALWNMVFMFLTDDVSLCVRGERSKREDEAEERPGGFAGRGGGEVARVSDILFCSR